MIRGTFCDLAIKFEGELALLIEAKAIGLDLKEAHVKQAVDYAANQGCEWVCLTNGVAWRIHRVVFAKPIEHELIAEFDLSKMNNRSRGDLELLWLLSKEGWQKSRLREFATQQQALNRFTLGAVVTSDTVVGVNRRELRRMNPDAKVSLEQVRDVLMQDVLKRDAVGGEKAEGARRALSRAVNRALRARSAKATDERTEVVSEDPPAD